MSQLVRSRFSVPQIHKPPAVEEVLGSMAELLRLQSLQIEVLRRCVGQEKFDAELKALGETPPEPVP